MKTFKEFNAKSIIVESDKDDDKKFKEVNKGREGKTLLGIDGKEISGKIYLGDGAYAYKSGGTLNVVAGTGMYGKTETTYISTKHFDLLKKAF